MARAVGGSLAFAIAERFLTENWIDICEMIDC
jgi:hypothetical protein